MGIAEAQVITVVAGLFRPTGIAIKDDKLFIAEADDGKISKIIVSDSSPVSCV